MPGKIHFIGICGKGMGALAVELHRLGWTVSGSDDNPYPPMSDYVAAAGIPVTTPCSVDRMPPDADLIVVGMRVAADNPELVRALGQGRAPVSYPDLLGSRFLRHTRKAVVAGGAGKSTTTALLAWILERCGKSPDYFLGEAVRGWPSRVRLAGAELAVIEGDEYASAFHDARPKFLHYDPEVVAVTNLLPDHPDLHPDAEALRNAFVPLVENLPPHGLLVLPGHDREAVALSRHSGCPVVTVGFEGRADERIEWKAREPSGSRFRFAGAEFTLPLCGSMNVLDAALAVMAAKHFGVAPSEAAAVLGDFPGLHNRQEMEEIGDVTLVRDKATHPRSLAGLFEAMRQRHPGRRLVSFLQPRATGGREWVYQKELPSVLAAADQVVLVPPYEHQPRPGQQWPGGSFCLDQLADETLDAGGRVTKATDAVEAVDLLGATLKSGDVVVLSVPEQGLELKAVVRSLLVQREPRPRP